MTTVDPTASTEGLDGARRAARPRRRPTEALAERLGVTQGQVSTVLVAMAVAVVLTIGGLPPVLRHRSAASSAAPAPAARTGGTAAAPAAPETTAGPEVASPVLGPVVDARPIEPVRATTTFDGASPPPATAGPAAPAVGTTAVFAPVGSAPEGVAVGADGVVFVATGGATGPSRILSFSATGVPGATFGVTGQPDDAGAGLTGLALDGQGGLFALDAATARVLRFDLATRRQTSYATLPDLPACQLVVAAVNGCEPGLRDDAPLPRAVAVDGQGNLFVTDAAQGAVWRIAAGGAQPAVFTSDAAFGSGDGISGIALAPDGALVVAPQAVDPEAAGGGAVYRIPVDGDKAGTRTLLARFAPGAGASGIALLHDGSMVVSLQDAGAVVLLDASGEEIRRVEGDALDAPLGVAFHGQTLLVTNGSPDNERWAVLAVGIR